MQIFIKKKLPFCPQIKEQYVRTVTELNAEISNLQEELRTTKNQYKVSNIQAAELRKTLEEMRTQLMKQVGSCSWQIWVEPSKNVPKIAHHLFFFCHIIIL